MGTGRGTFLTLTVVILGAAAVMASRQAHQRDTDLTKAHVTASMNGLLEARYSRLATRVDQYAEVLSRSKPEDLSNALREAPRTDLNTIEAVGLDRGGTSGGAVSPLLRLPQILAGMESARDTGSPTATVVGPSSDATLVVAWPWYSRATLADTATRRAASTGWVIGLSPMRTVVGPILESATLSGARVSIGFPPAGPGPIEGTLADGTSFSLTHVPEGSWVPTWLLAGFALAASIAAGLGSRARSRQFLRAENREAELLRQIKLVSDLSLTLQESLEIGDVLPAALAQTVQSLNLTYSGVLSGATGQGIEILSVGRRPGVLTERRWSPESRTAEAGQLVRLPLRRANRTLGHLEVVAGHPLGQVELACLRASADLLAGAMYNADLYEREQDSVRRLRDLDELKDDFLATVSHELRTPLTVLIGFTSLLSTSWQRMPDTKREDALGKMLRHATSLSGLVNDLLDFVTERRTTPALTQEIPLHLHVEQVVDQLRPSCPQHQLDVTVHKESWAWTDPRAVERILGNLITNAAKYSPPGSVISVVLDGDDESASVAVEDHGPGIRAEDRERIFERFYRGDSDASRATRGSGIGLAVVRSWLISVRARLEIVTSPGHGTTMTVHFPIASDTALHGAGSVVWLDPAVPEQERA